jgi:NAD(P)-dependent dehydrogenase (short-subunit alcohol dehydrogenase family)
LLPVEVLSHLFRRLFLTALLEAHQDNQLKFFGEHQGLADRRVYGATKASMIGFTRSLAREVGRLGITVNAIAPGFIETEMTAGLSIEDRGRVARRSALQRLAEPADVAGSVEYLLSDKARNITGTVITVDAGSTA